MCGDRPRLPDPIRKQAAKPEDPGCRKGGSPMKTWKWKKSHQNQERALALCRDGFSCAEIAVMMGLCTITVRNYLRDAGVSIPDQRCRRQKVRNTADADRVVRLYQTPLPAVMVARMLGLSVDLVVAVLRSAG